MEFDYKASYAVYNWELFYHIPMLIAQRLSDNSRYDEARQWYHYVFDPSKTPTSTSPARFWIFKPLADLASGTIETLDGLLAHIHSTAPDAMAQVALMEHDPFQPFAIGRMRPLAFMMYTLMKYLDNLIAWGDHLFARDTIESINEATQLYIMASNLLGRRPQEVPQRAESKKYSYAELETMTGGVDELGLATAPIETFFDPGAAPPAGTAGAALLTSYNMSYFCLGPNPKLLGYWDTIADRLFKIRNCRNLQGVVRQLPLFEPPIDPALLARAAARGISIDSVLDDAAGLNAPIYRFPYLVQKANEFCNDVKALGSSLLAALEKKDGEMLALLRQGHERAVLNAALAVKQQQVDEGRANLAALQKTKENILARKEYYDQRPYINQHEQQHLDSLRQSIEKHTAALMLQELAQALSLIPQFHATPMAVGTSFGGQQLSTAVGMVTNKFNFDATVLGIVGSMASTLGGYDRRMDDWKFQSKSAELEAAQIDKQIVAAEIRIAIAEKEIDNQKLQIENSEQVDQFMRSKFTNADLYDWMIRQISGTYFSAYQLAVAMARKAEKSYFKEIPESNRISAGFIEGGYWDSLRKGLFAAEKLQYDIRTMESAFTDENVRTLELTKNVSLAMLNADMLVNLKSSGSCTIHIPEELYDLDYPTHYNRTIKSISVTIPCITGPYANIPCTVSLSNGSVRRTGGTTLVALNSGVNSIATSNAQNDNGMFDFNFKDERYLPFEGAGAVCDISLTLGGLSGAGHGILPFNFQTISDVIIHIKYTANQGAPDRSLAVYNHLLNAAAVSDRITRFFSLKHEFPEVWNQFVNVATGTSTVTASLTFRADQFPFFKNVKTIMVDPPNFTLRTKSGVSSYSIMVSTSLGSLSVTAAAGATYSLTISGGSDPLSDFDSKLDDIYLVVHYKVTA